MNSTAQISLEAEPMQLLESHSKNTRLLDTALFVRASTGSIEPLID